MVRTVILTAVAKLLGLELVAAISQRDWKRITIYSTIIERDYLGAVLVPARADDGSWHYLPVQGDVWVFRRRRV